MNCTMSISLYNYVPCNSTWTCLNYKNHKKCMFVQIAIPYLTLTFVFSCFMFQLSVISALLLFACRLIYGSEDKLINSDLNKLEGEALETCLSLAIITQISYYTWRELLPKWKLIIAQKALRESNESDCEEKTKNSTTNSFKSPNEANLSVECTDAMNKAENSKPNVAISLIWLKCALFFTFIVYLILLGVPYYFVQKYF